MNISRARNLKPGDKVVTAFSNSHRIATVVSVSLPHITVTTTLESGEERQRVCRYRSVFEVDDYRRRFGEPKESKA